MSGARRSVGGVLALLLPARCAVCRMPGPGLCPRCATALPPAPQLPPPAGLDRCTALLAYDGGSRSLVAALKYRNHRDALDRVAGALAVLLEDLLGDLDPGPEPLVTWAPTSPARRRGRGYDQAELLARATAVRGGRRAVPLLRRHPGPAQTGRDRVARLAGPSFHPARAVPSTVVVVDDVWTTGATLAAAAVALRTGGAQRVLGLVLAVRP
jgi:predicted amidophosphoribosyltransferase